MSQGPPAVDASAAPRVVGSEVDELAARLCELAGHVHAATAELVGLLGRLEALGGWQGAGIRSLGHWASIYLGIDLRTAARQARVGRQLEAPPATSTPTTSCSGPTAASPTSTTSCCYAATTTGCCTKAATARPWSTGGPASCGPTAPPSGPPTPHHPTRPEAAAHCAAATAARHTIDQHSAEARCGGAPWWSPHPTLDALFS